MQELLFLRRISQFEGDMDPQVYAAQVCAYAFPSLFFVLFSVFLVALFLLANLIGHRYITTTTTIRTSTSLQIPITKPFYILYMMNM